MERISWLELRMMQLVNKLEQMLNLMLQQGNNIFYDHTLLDALVTVLGKENTINVKELNDIWKANRKHKKDHSTTKFNLEELQKSWIAGFKGEELEKFKELLDKASRWFAEGEYKKGLRCLEHAAVLSPDNFSLNLFLGVAFFKERRTALSRGYFQKIYTNNSNNEFAGLLLGLSCCEEGENEEAKEILAKIVRKKIRSFSAHYAYGRLLIIEDKWDDAIVQFKKALSSKPSPEAHYILASAYFCSEQLELAESHLYKAIEADKAFAEAVFLLGLVVLKQGKEKQALECFDLAAILETDEKLYEIKEKRVKRFTRKNMMPPLFATLRLSKKHLVSSGDKRIADLVWKDALGEDEAGFDNSDE